MAKAKCKTCGSTDDDIFYSSIKTYCKKHWKEKVKKNRESKAEYYREKERERTHDPKRIAQRNLKLNGKIGLYCVIPKGHKARGEELDSRKLYLKRNPKKRYATEQVAYAIRTGRLKKSPCEVCGEKKAHAHHDDYNEPLNIRWLCNKHHIEHHAKIVEVNNVH